MDPFTTFCLGLFFIAGGWAPAPDSRRKNFLGGLVTFLLVTIGIVTCMIAMVQIIPERDFGFLVLISVTLAVLVVHMFMPTTEDDAE